eukprot:6207903-Pleurochrysis_carterae.AAC.1
MGSELCTECLDAEGFTRWGESMRSERFTSTWRAKAELSSSRHLFFAACADFDYSLLTIFDA